MNKFDKCPYCKNDWIKNSQINSNDIDLTCVTCNIHYYYYIGRWHYMIKCGIINNINVKWDFADNKSAIYNHDFSFYIILPMLPFDISANKLKLYILMS
jgi:hypothetical protein